MVILFRTNEVERNLGYYKIPSGINLCSVVHLAPNIGMYENTNNLSAM